MAYKAITVFGLSPVIGNVSFPSKEELGMGIRPFSMKLAQDIDRVSDYAIYSSSCATFNTTIIGSTINDCFRLSASRRHN